MNAGELVPYSTAEQMAAEYRDSIVKIREAAETIGEQCDRLKSAFLASDYAFAISLHHGSRSNADTIDAIIEQMKLAAWKAIIERLNIRRLMRSKRIAELDSALGNGGRRYHGHGDDKPPEFPDITPETIIAVASGYVMSANEFLEEAVAEEYDHWRPRYDNEYKTNRNGFYKLTPKLIKGYTVEHGYGGNGRYRCNYHNQAHVTALDNIFHMLDGKGPVKEYKGALATAIETSADGNGETDYFRFKCFGNGNIHLWFKRLDLLNLFNQIAAKSDRLGQERRAG